MMKSFQNLTMISLLVTSYWMQKSRQKFPNSKITTWYHGPTSFKCECPEDNQCLSRPFPKLVVSFYYHEGVDPNEKNLPSVLDDVNKSAHGIPFNSTAQTAKTVEFTVRCEEFQKARLEVKIEDKRMTGSTKKDEEIVSYVRGLLLLSM